VSDRSDAVESCSGSSAEEELVSERVSVDVSADAELHMPTRYAHVVLIWPIALPGTGELRTELDAVLDRVELVREEDGALVITRGEHVLRIARPELESALALDGERVLRAHTGTHVLALEREPGVVVLYRPVGNVELGLVAASGWRVFPPRLPEQPIFYPVTNLAYAREIAERWNAAEGRGVHVVRFRVDEAALARWPVRCVGARHHTELWVPAGELDAFHAAMKGPIEEVELTPAPRGRSQ
jgi:hypothetical protein